MGLVYYKKRRKPSKEMALLIKVDYWLSTKWAVPSGQKTFSPKETRVKRRLHSKRCLSHPSQSRDNICPPHVFYF